MELLVGQQQRLLLPCRVSAPFLSLFCPPAWADASPVPSTSSTYHAMIGGVVAVIVFLLLSLLIVLGHYLIRHKGTALRGAGGLEGVSGQLRNVPGNAGGGSSHPCSPSLCPGIVPVSPSAPPCAFLLLLSLRLPLPCPSPGDMVAPGRRPPPVLMCE